MNREIKFRAYVKQGMYGGRRCFESMMEYNVPVVDGKYAMWADGYELYGTFEDVPLMQFTGLKDKNGKEIYEGDIILVKDPSGTVNDYEAQVCWSQKESSWAFKCGLDWKRPTESLWAWILEKDIEVIGNIYENKELANNDTQKS